MVVDASLALAWIFADEQEASAQKVLDRVLLEGAIAPSLWRWEIQNGLRMAERRKRIDVEGMRRAVGQLRLLPVVIEPPPVLGRELEIAYKHGLSVYHAAYLDLAIRENKELATLDRELALAAQRLGVLAKECA